jgi:hypothetical protein
MRNAIANNKRVSLIAKARATPRMMNTTKTDHLKRPAYVSG